MSNPKDPSVIEPEDINDFPLSVRYTTRRAILNAITKAKITDRTYKPQKIICRLPNVAIPNNWLNKTQIKGRK